MKNKKTTKPLVFDKMKGKSFKGAEITKFGEMTVIPQMKLREKWFYKCITQF